MNITETFWSDGDVYSHVKDHADKINFKLDKLALCTEVKLDARFSRIRTEETNAGNLISDLMRSHHDADFGLINGGNIRANVEFEAGPLPLRFIA